MVQINTIAIPTHILCDNYMQVANNYTMKSSQHAGWPIDQFASSIHFCAIHFNVVRVTMVRLPHWNNDRCVCILQSYDLYFLRVSKSVIPLPPTLHVPTPTQTACHTGFKRSLYRQCLLLTLPVKESGTAKILLFCLLLRGPLCLELWINDINRRVLTCLCQHHTHTDYYLHITRKSNHKSETRYLMVCSSQIMSHIVCHVTRIKTTFCVKFFHRSFSFSLSSSTSCR